MSRLTPLEIQKHEFTRKWKGFDPVEVESYLALVAEEMEEVARANAELETRARRLGEENEEHRERERILKETLVAAQRASEDIRGTAQGAEMTCARR
jgi:cell division initiation protein